MDTKKIILITTGIVVLASALFFGIRWRKKRLMYKGQEIQQEQISQILKERLQSLEFRELVRRKINMTDSLDAFLDKTHGEYIIDQFNHVYELNEFVPVWLHTEGPKPAVNEYLKVLKGAPGEGLNPEHYNLFEIERKLDSIYPLDYEDVDLVMLLEADFLLTASSIRYATHLRFGRIDPTKLADYWKTYSGADEPDVAAYLLQAVNTGNIEPAYQDLVPNNKYYKGLREAMKRYQNLLAHGGWTETSDVEYLPGDTGEHIRQLRKRLHLEITAVDTASTVFDSTLADQIKIYQELHGIVGDGKIEKGTLKALNTGMEEKLNKILLNMERTRWLPDYSSYIFVNIPEYKLRVYKENNRELEMRVIVGKEYTSTPVFNDTLEYIVFSPTWGVPNSIAANEMLPVIRKDPSYLTRNNYNLYRNGRKVSPASVNWSSVSADDFNYQIVQQPGRGNALGDVKFIFPNDMNIYLHDTPTGHLFSRNERMFSHGCIRIEKPDSLALVLLAETGDWPMSRIKENFGLSSPMKVDLPEKLPVQIFYLTAWMDEQGMVNFRNDIYGHDARQIGFLNDLLV